MESSPPHAFCVSEGSTRQFGTLSWGVVHGPGHFYKLFMHWMYEVRRYFHHIVVWKIFRTSRLWLPCATDEMLVKRQEDAVAQKEWGGSLRSSFSRTRERLNILRESRSRAASRGGGGRSGSAASSWFRDLSDAVFNPGKVAEAQDEARRRLQRPLVLLFVRPRSAPQSWFSHAWRDLHTPNASTLRRHRWHCFAHAEHSMCHACI